LWKCFTAGQGPDYVLWEMIFEYLRLDQVDGRREALQAEVCVAGELAVRKRRCLGSMRRFIKAIVGYRE
jgi:hypothetical protein